MAPGTAGTVSQQSAAFLSRTSRPGFGAKLGQKTFEMYKLVVLVVVACALLAGAAAKPQVLVDAYGYGGYYAAPAYVASYSAPLAYSYPYAYAYSYPYAYV